MNTCFLMLLGILLNLPQKLLKSGLHNLHESLSEINILFGTNLNTISRVEFLRKVVQRRTISMSSVAALLFVTVRYGKVSISSSWRTNLELFKFKRKNLDVCKRQRKARRFKAFKHVKVEIAPK